MKALKCVFCSVFWIAALSPVQYVLADDPPHLATIVVTPIAPTMYVGQSLVFTATGYDQYGNPFPIPNPIWSANQRYGTIVPDPNNPNRATLTATAPGTGGVACQDGPGMASVIDSTEVTILPPAPPSPTEPASAEPSPTEPSPTVVDPSEIIPLPPLVTVEATPSEPGSGPVGCCGGSAMLLPLFGVILWRTRGKK